MSRISFVSSNVFVELSLLLLLVSSLLLQEESMYKGSLLLQFLAVTSDAVLMGLSGSSEGGSSAQLPVVPVALSFLSRSRCFLWFHLNNLIYNYM